MGQIPETGIAAGRPPAHTRRDTSAVNENHIEDITLAIILALIGVVTAALIMTR